MNSICSFLLFVYQGCLCFLFYSYGLACLCYPYVQLCPFDKSDDIFRFSLVLFSIFVSKIFKVDDLMQLNMFL